MQISYFSGLSFTVSSVFIMFYPFGDDMGSFHLLRLAPPAAPSRLRTWILVDGCWWDFSRKNILEKSTICQLSTFWWNLPCNSTWDFDESWNLWIFQQLITSLSTMTTMHQGVDRMQRTWRQGDDRTGHSDPPKRLEKSNPTDIIWWFSYCFFGGYFDWILL